MFNKNVRVTLVVLTMNGVSSTYVTSSKDAAEKLLYANAVRNWRDFVSTPIPRSRASVLEQFYNQTPDAEYVIETAQLISNKAVADQQKAADKVVEKANPKQKKAVVAQS